MTPGERAQILTERNNAGWDVRDLLPQATPLTEEDFRVALRLAFASIDADAPHPNTLRAIARALARYFSEGHV